MRKMTMTCLAVVAIACGAAVAQAQDKAAAAPSDDIVDPYDFISIGVGIPAVSVNWWTRQIGFFDSVSPFMITFSPPQFQGVWKQKTVKDANGNLTVQYMRFAYWSFAFGIQITKPQGGSVELGFSVIPYIVRIGPWSAGVGVLWTSTDRVTLDGHAWNILLPITYNLPISTGSQPAASTAQASPPS